MEKAHLTALGLPTIEYALSDPVEALMICRDSQLAYDKADQERKMDLNAAVYAAAYALERDHAKWSDFVRRANAMKVLSRKIKRDKHMNNLLEIVCRFVLGFKHSYDHAFKLARVFDLCNLEGVKPHLFNQRIKTGRGVGKLYTRACKMLPRQGKSKDEQIEIRQGYKERRGFDNFSDLNADLEKKDDQADEILKLTAAVERSVLRLGKATGQYLVVIDAGERRFEQLVGLNEKEFRSLSIFKVGTTPSGWVNLKARNPRRVRNARRARRARAADARRDRSKAPFCSDLSVL